MSTVQREAFKRIREEIESRQEVNMKGELDILDGALHELGRLQCFLKSTLSGKLTSITHNMRSLREELYQIIGELDKKEKENE